LTIVGDPIAWRSLGLTVTEDGLVPLFGTCLRIEASDSDESESTRPDGSGSVGTVSSWTLSGRKLGPAAIDGLRTAWVEPMGPVHADHALGAAGLDHVVVLTPDLERTSAAITDTTGCELRRVREVGTMRQGFHRIGERGSSGLVVELVERPELFAGPARFWGVVLIVDDLDQACAFLGSDRISEARDAVQPGRRIATIRADAGLGLPVALMTP
jgi:catechol 2,3-dioxygenase-like lactoylglutathione lyase family enzyme